jgi:hypothetical protein
MTETWSSGKEASTARRMSVAVVFFAGMYLVSLFAFSVRLSDVRTPECKRESARAWERVSESETARERCHVACCICCMESVRVVCVVDWYSIRMCVVRCVVHE